MFLFLDLCTVTPNLGGTFRLGKNPTSLTLIKDHCFESEIILFSYFNIERAYITACVHVQVLV